MLELAFQEIVYDVLPRGRALGDENMQSLGFQWLKQRVPEYSILASTRVLGVQILRKYKSVTRTRHEY